MKKFIKISFKKIIRKPKNQYLNDKTIILKNNEKITTFEKLCKFFENLCKNRKKNMKKIENKFRKNI